MRDFKRNTSPALTVMICGVKLAPTEQATHSPKQMLIRLVVTIGCSILGQAKTLLMIRKQSINNIQFFFQVSIIYLTTCFSDS